MTHDPINDPVFGTLTWDGKRHQWFVQVRLTPKHRIDVTIDWDEREPLEELLARCRTAFLRVRNDEQAYRQATADAMLESCNAWREEDTAEETRESFARKIELGLIVLRSDGQVELWYDDGEEFFPGHAIRTLLDASGSFIRAGLEG
jgi:hypothetical protein